MSVLVDRTYVGPPRLVTPAPAPALCPAIPASSGLDRYRTISLAVHVQLRDALPMIPLV